jgi:hypothetical protein
MAAEGAEVGEVDSLPVSVGNDDTLLAAEGAEIGEVDLLPAAFRRDALIIPVACFPNTGIDIRGGSLSISRN